MEKLEINETPIRTSKNFAINSIILDKINIPNNFCYFSNVDIKCESTKDNVHFDNREFSHLVYGLGAELENQVKEKCNCPLKIELNSRLNKILEIDFNFNDSNRHLAENIEIVATENTKSTVILKYKSDDEINYYHNGIVRVLANTNAEVNIILVNFMGIRATNFLSIENLLKEKSQVSYTIVDFGGKVSCTNFYSNVEGKNSKAELNTIYLGKGKQLFDLNYIDELKGEKSVAKIEVQGALEDEAVKHFKGTIDFKKGCKKSTGSENEACMLLSEKAKSIALPVLLCSEEDVDGEHSTSSGKVGEKELFYIMSRGFKLKEAKKLLVRAKFNSIIEKIKKEELKEEVYSEIDKRLN